MGIGGITSTNNMSVMQQRTAADLKDQKSKSIQNEITEVKQQMQKLSAAEDLSANEKTNARKKLRKEESALNTELKQHQEELLRSHKREIRLAELLEDNKVPAIKEESEDKAQTKEADSSDTADTKTLPADDRQAAQPGTVITQNNDGTVILKEVMNPSGSLDAQTETTQADAVKEEVIAKEDTGSTDEEEVSDANLPGNDMQAMVSADSSLQQASRQGTVIAKIKDGIAILKGEIKQDENRSVDTERKQAALEKMQRQEQRATAFQSAVLEEADDAMKSAAKTNGAENKADTENTLYVSGLSTPPEEQASQQRFYVSFG